MCFLLDVHLRRVPGTGDARKIFAYNIKMPSEWNKAVKYAFKAGRKTNKSYSLKDAMYAAKKIYKKGKMNVMTMGKQSRRRASPKKGYNRRRTHRGGSAVVPEQAGASMLQNLSKMTGVGGMNDAAPVANKTEAPVSSK
jgi:hypothetical protein